MEYCINISNDKEKYVVHFSVCFSHFANGSECLTEANVSLALEQECMYIQILKYQNIHNNRKIIIKVKVN